jgi:hypothetical protein
MTAFAFSTSRPHRQVLDGTLPSDWQLIGRFETVARWFVAIFDPVTVGRERPPGKASAASIFRWRPKFRALVIEFRPRGCAAACSSVCAEARRNAFRLFQDQLTNHLTADIHAQLAPIRGGRSGFGQ